MSVCNQRRPHVRSVPYTNITYKDILYQDFTVIFNSLELSL